ncbi:MAG: hypothetical protein JXA69_15290 [Phycisphaerae bacterium]|nr:hypothetical protein [Phycisphaerae bacterium]
MSIRDCLFGIMMLVCAFLGTTPVSAEGVVEANLNGLTLVLDADTGSIVEMSYPGVGKMIDTPAARASIIDMAFPIKEWEPLRLASRYSSGARIEKTANRVTITWDVLGASRRRTARSKVQDAVQLQYDEKTKRYVWARLPGNPFDIQGKVSATVTLKAAPDGKSVLMGCTVENNTPLTIPQVLFPDFFGLVPFHGTDNTVIRTSGYVSRPFVELWTDPNNGINYYAVDSRYCGIETASGGGFGSTPMIAKWMDFGGLNGGFSLFRKRWSWGPESDKAGYQEKVWMKLSELDNKLRLACTHVVDIKPGETWETEEYVLTPHTHGWAKGIEPYRQFVRDNLKRQYPVPKHVREGIGYRTVYMTEAYPNDPDGDYTFKCSDLPMLAKECKGNGIDEMCLWAWNWNLQVPVTPPFPQIGTEEGMRKAVEECRKIGVNVNLFISLMALANPTAQRYGLQVPPPSEGWTYHAEFVPVMRPYYGSGLSCAHIATTDARWQEGVYDACTHLIDTMSPSIGWDQFMGYPSEPGLYTLIERIRAYAKARDPESTLNGESVTNIDNDAQFLDYTWNWNGWPWRGDGDCRPFNSVYPAPRLNANVDRSPRQVRGAFVDNMYLNVFTSRKGGINGSGRISDYPALSAALKQCATIRKQFLPYFLDGTLIGDCILAEELPPVRLSTYVLRDRALVVMMNDMGRDSSISFKCDLLPWIASTSGKYEVKAYDSGGKLIGTKAVDAAWHEQTEIVKNSDLSIYEVIAQP